MSAELFILLIALPMLGWHLWRIAKVLNGAVEVLQTVHAEAQASAEERERRREAEAAGALYDAVRVREAEYVLAVLETDPECSQCREAVEAGRQRLRDRTRRYPRNPDSLKTFAKPTGHA